MSVDFDFSELHEFVVQLDAADDRLVRNVTSAVKVSALKGRRAWQAAARGNAGRHLPGYPSAIDYDDVENHDGVIGTDLGPNLGRNQGALGIVEDAAGGVNSRPQRNYVPAEKVIEKDLVVGVLKAVDDAFGGV